MAIKTFTVNLQGNFADKAKDAAGAAFTLTGSISALESATESLGGSMLGSLIKFDLLKRGAEFAVRAISELAEQALDASENVERMSQSFGALSGTGVEGGRAVLEQIRNIAAQLPQSERTVQRWAQGLMSVGVTDMSDLQNQLGAIAGAEALVEGGGEKVRGLLMRLNEASERGTKVKFSMAQLAGTGVTEKELLAQLGMTPQQLDAAKKAATLTGGQIADALTGAINAKAQGPLEAMSAEFGTAITKGKDAFIHLLEGIDFSGLTGQLRIFFGYFDQSQPSGQALKLGIGGGIQGIVDTLTKLAPMARHFFLEVILYSLKAYNFLRPLVSGFLDFLGTITKTKEFTEGLQALAIGVGVVAAAFAALTAGAIAGIALIVTGLGKLSEWAKSVGEWMGDAAFHLVEFATKGAQAATDFVKGFVQGIEQKISEVVGAVERMGTAAWDAVKRTLHLGSPSRLMIEAGRNVGEGLAIGTEQSVPRVTEAAVSMAGAAARAPQAGSGAGVTQRNDIHIEVYARDNQQAREVVDELEERLPSLFERWALSQGVAPA